MKKLLIILGFILATWAVLGQFTLVMTRVTQKELTYVGEILRYWGYMTIWTNSLIAVTFGTMLFAPNSSWGKWLGRHSVQTAIMLYISLVGIVYHLLLAKLVTFTTNLDRIHDLYLHTLVPIVYALYWFFYSKRERLPFKQSINWIIYPFCYSMYTLVKGEIVNVYPYPFFDVSALGYASVLTNMIGFAVVYIIVGCMLIALNNLMSISKDLSK